MAASQTPSKDGPALPSQPPKIRACLFDMDGLLIDSEDLYTICTNTILAKYNKPPIPWDIKAQLQGRPGPDAGRIFQEWAQLPIDREEFMKQQTELQRKLFPGTRALEGVEVLLGRLDGTGKKTGEGKRGANKKVYMALATSSHKGNFALKTTHLEDTVFRYFASDLRVLGDDTRIPPGRGKPCADIYLLALECVNQGIRNKNRERRQQQKTTGRGIRDAATGTGMGDVDVVDGAGDAAVVVDGDDGGSSGDGHGEEKEITPAECLVFEDSVPGVEAGRRAGMQVIWCPHPGLLNEYKGREKEVLAGLTGISGGSKTSGESVGAVDDGWARLVTSLEDFPYTEYGIEV